MKLLQSMKEFIDKLSKRGKADFKLTILCMK